MTATTAPPVIEVTMEEIEDLLRKASEGPLTAEERATIRALAVSYLAVLTEIENKKSSIRTLRELVFGAKTEKKENVVGDGGKPPEGGTKDEPETAPKEKEKAKPKGHGRTPAGGYTGAKTVRVRHETLRHGAPCPDGCGGSVYGQKEPKVLVRITACAPFSATVYEKQRMRCGLCGKIFVAGSPPGVGEEKFDASVGAMLGTLRYGSGFPMNRIATLQKAVGVPLPVSTQWEILEDSAKRLERVHEELVRLAAQGVLFVNDDTPMKILSIMADLKERRARGEEPERTGMFTSGIVSELLDGHQVALYYTGRHHAGENLAELLRERAAGLGTPMQMCDALERNLPEPLKTILGNCLVHARRGFIRVNESFPAEVRHVVEELSLVYRNDARAKAEGMSPEERLRFHQEMSKPVMDRLLLWMDGQIQEKKTEPNSGLGKAIEYCRKRWDRLTLFLRHAGAPLDSNLVERMLKKAILHRRNSLFFKTENGARVGDLFMALIATAKLAGVDPFHYLTELLRHPAEIAASPGDWLPWNYRATLGRPPPVT
jgi:transposase